MLPQVLVALLLQGNNTVNPVGLAATGGVGDVTLVTEQNVPVTGLQGQGFVGTATVVQGGGVNVSVTGLSATATVGTGTSIIINGVNVPPTWV